MVAYEDPIKIIEISHRYSFSLNCSKNTFLGEFGQRRKRFLVLPWPIILFKDESLIIWCPQRRQVSMLYLLHSLYFGQLQSNTHSPPQFEMQFIFLSMPLIFFCVLIIYKFVIGRFNDGIAYKWSGRTLYLFNSTTNICQSWCLDTHFIPNNSD